MASIVALEDEPGHCIQLRHVFVAASVIKSRFAYLFLLKSPFTARSFQKWKADVPGWLAGCDLFRDRYKHRAAVLCLAC